MANDQQPPPPAVQQQQQQQNNPQNTDANATNDDPLTPITRLLRYLYTGTTAASIPVKSTNAPNLLNIANTLACVIDMATAQPNLPIATIRKVKYFLSIFFVNFLIAIFFFNFLWCLTYR